MWYLGVCLDGIRKELGTFSKGNQYTNRDPNQILPYYEVLVITCVLDKTTRLKKVKYMTQ